MVQKRMKKNSVFVVFFFKNLFIFLFFVFFIKGLEWKVCAFVICC